MSKIQVKQTVKHKNNNRKKSQASKKTNVNVDIEALRKTYIETLRAIYKKVYEEFKKTIINLMVLQQKGAIKSLNAKKSIGKKIKNYTENDIKEALSEDILTAEQLKKLADNTLAYQRQKSKTEYKKRVEIAIENYKRQHLVGVVSDDIAEKIADKVWDDMQSEFESLIDNVDWEVESDAEYEKMLKFLKKGDRGFESLKRRLKAGTDKDKGILIPNDRDRAITVNILSEQLKELKRKVKEGVLTEEQYKTFETNLVNDVAEQIYANKNLEKARINEIKKFIETGDESVLGNVYNFTTPEHKQNYIRQIKKRFETASKLKNIVSEDVKLRKDMLQRVREQAIKKANNECKRLGIGKYGSHITLGDTSKILESSKSKIQNVLNNTKKQNSITPSTFQRIVDIDHIFLKDEVKPEITFTTKSGLKKVIPAEIIPKEDLIDEIRHVSKLTSALIPAKFVKKGIIDEYYGAVIAATYFQMLVSNTPIDEEYSYFEKRIHYGTSKIKLPETMEDYDEADIDKQLENNKKVYLVEHTHVPDKEFIRDFWVLHYKGVEFYSKDYDKRLFEKKSDMKSAHIIAIDIYDRTKNLENKNVDFYAENTNWRYNMLEYGGYTRDGETSIGSKYGYEHGVKNKHSYQAPYGMKRLVDGLWNILVTSGRHYGYVSEFLNKNRNKLDVSKIESKIVKMITTDYPEIKQVGFTDKDEYIRLLKSDITPQ